MTALSILTDHWLIVSALAAFFFGGVGVAFLTLAADRNKALIHAERIDRKRKNSTIIYKLLLKQHGALKAVLFIFANNTAAALIWFSIGGVLLILPFVMLALSGYILILMLAKYRERMTLILFTMLPFEIGAFFVASVAGLNIGQEIFFGGDPASALKEWAIPFFSLAVPMLFIAAIFEGIGLHRIYIVQNYPLPDKVMESLADDQNASPSR